MHELVRQGHVDCGGFLDEGLLAGAAATIGIFPIGAAALGRPVNARLPCQLLYLLVEDLIVHVRRGPHVATIAAFCNESQLLSGACG